MERQLSGGEDPSKQNRSYQIEQRKQRNLEAARRYKKTAKGRKKNVEAVRRFRLKQERARTQTTEEHNPETGDLQPENFTEQRRNQLLQILSKGAHGLVEYGVGEEIKRVGLKLGLTEAERQQYEKLRHEIYSQRIFFPEGVDRKQRFVVTGLETVTETKKLNNVLTFIMSDTTRSAIRRDTPDKKPYLVFYK